MRLRKASIFLVFVFMFSIHTVSDVPSSDFFIKVSTKVSPSEINVMGSGKEPMEATVELILQAPKVGLPLDLVLVVDRSATIEAEIEVAIELMKSLLKLLSDIDRVALVSFADSAVQHTRLTSKGEVIAALTSLKPGGRTALGDAIALTNKILQEEGRPGATWAAVILGDGMSNVGIDPQTAVGEAIEKGIIFFTVGIGRYNNAKGLEDIARATGGKAFFPRIFSPISPKEMEEISKTAGEIIRPFKNITATNINVKLMLPPHVNYEGEITWDCEILDRSLECAIPQLAMGQLWKLSYKISSNKTGIVPIIAENSRVEFQVQGLPLRSVAIPVQTIKVINIPPQADFSYEPPLPKAGQIVQFINKSFDYDTIVKYRWSFGDGSFSALANPTHRYQDPGTYTVELCVADEEGISDCTTKTITVKPVEAIVTRYIETFPNSEVLPGRYYEVKVEINVKSELGGMGLEEVLPPGWEVEIAEQEGVSVKRLANRIQWVWMDAILAGEIKRVSYKVKVPQGEKADIFQIEGKVCSFAPRFEAEVGGDFGIKVVEALDVKIAIAHITPTGELDPADSDTIEDHQIEKAKEYYENDLEVPGTDGKKIDFEILLELLAYWKNKIPVTEPLPAS
jgi:PKD repeat protein/uncharacterized protein YegL